MKIQEGHQLSQSNKCLQEPKLTTELAAATWNPRQQPTSSEMNEAIGLDSDVKASKEVTLAESEI